MGVYHENNTNRSAALGMTVNICGVFLVLTSVSAQGRTIPDASKSYYGAEAFQMALAFWLVLDVALLVQAWESLHARVFFPGLCADAVAVGCLFYSLTFKSPFSDAAWIIAVFLHASNDPLKRKVVISTVSVCEETDTVYTPFYADNQGSGYQALHK